MKRKYKYISELCNENVHAVSESIVHKRYRGIHEKKQWISKM